MRQAAAPDVPSTAASAAAAGRAADAASAAAAEAVEFPLVPPSKSPFESPSWGQAVAEAAQAAFAALPPTGKPQPHEHTVMAAFLVSTSDNLQGLASGGPAHAGAPGKLQKHRLSILLLSGKPQDRSVGCTFLFIPPCCSGAGHSASNVQQQSSSSVEGSAAQVLVARYQAQGPAGDPSCGWWRSARGLSAWQARRAVPGAICLTTLTPRQVPLNPRP